MVGARARQRSASGIAEPLVEVGQSHVSMEERVRCAEVTRSVDLRQALRIAVEKRLCLLADGDVVVYERNGNACIGIRAVERPGVRFVIRSAKPAFKLGDDVLEVRDGSQRRGGGILARCFDDIVMPSERRARVGVAYEPCVEQAAHTIGKLARIGNGGDAL